jgi:hypothetical protein
MMIVAVLSICYKPGISNSNLVAGCIEAFIVSAGNYPPSPQTYNLRLTHILLSIHLSLGGLDLSQSCLDWESQSQRFQKACLDNRENLNSFKKRVSTIEKSQFCCDTTLQSQNEIFLTWSPTKSLNNVKISWYSGHRLMGSLWDRDKLIPITDWF